MLDLDSTSFTHQQVANEGLQSILETCGGRLELLSPRCTALATRSAITTTAVHCPNIRYLAVCCDKGDDIQASPSTTLHAKFVVKQFGHVYSKVERLWLWDDTVGKNTFLTLGRRNVFPRLLGCNVTIRWYHEKRLMRKWKRRVEGRDSWAAWMPYSVVVW